MATLILHPGKEKSVLRRHPWLFSGAVARLEGRARAGDTVDVVSHEGRPLGRAAWSPASQIRARIWSFDAEETIDHAFFKRRVAASVARRAALPELAGQQGLRLIHAESDGLPGVVADRYGDTVVVQLSTAGADKWRGAIADSLHKATGCARIYERSDLEVRKLEVLAAVTGWIQGAAGETELVIEENGVRMAVDIVGGHKTGFYLDQRDNRRRVAELARDRRVLNCFCYTAGFSLQALAGGAREVVSVDSSGPALATVLLLRLFVGRYLVHRESVAGLAPGRVGANCRLRVPCTQIASMLRMPFSGLAGTAWMIWLAGGGGVWMQAPK
jgi:23S rRNA (cytosine1962-C5)-methyltransferase